MNIQELFLTALGLSMDAFAISISLGLTTSGESSYKKGFIIGGYFGGFQAAMPLIGYLLASLFSNVIISFDHWVAFILLAVIGLKMAIESFKKEEEEVKSSEDHVGTEEASSEASIKSISEASIENASESISEAGLNEKGRIEASLSPAKMLPLSIATSIDALAVGVSFAFLKVNIIYAVIFIGLVTFAMSVAGVKAGKAFGDKLKSKAELIGGVILVLIGLKILLNHLGVINF